MLYRYLHTCRKALAPLCALLALALWALPAQASHLRGGELTYRYLGANKYELTATFYRDCALGIALDVSYPFEVYDKASSVLAQTATMNQVSLQTLTGFIPGCNYPAGTCVELGIYKDTVTLTNTLAQGSQGYYVSYTTCCRNANIINMVANGGMVWSCFIPPNTYANTSPRFLNKPVPYLCVNQPFVFSNVVTDQNGDSLVYRMAQPFAGYGATPGVPPFDTLAYAAGYSFPGNQIATQSGISLNAATGDIYLTPNTLGNWVLTLNVDEYRRVPGQPAVFLGSVRRDLQFVVGNQCGNGFQPLIDTTGNGVASLSGTTFTIKAGTAFCFPIKARDPQGDTVFLSKIGGIFDASAGFAPPYATMPNTSGDSVATTQFCWTPAANQVSTQPYTFVLTAVDDNCNFSQQTYKIYVTSFCGGTTTYTTPTGTVTDGSGTSSYANNSDCRYLIQPAGATSITLTFTQLGTQSGQDFVYVYKGNSTAGQLVGTYSGSTLPSSITVAGGSMLVVFTSNATVQGAGFSANYTSTIITLNIGTIAPTAYCPGGAISIPFTAGVGFLAGNVFTAQLSDGQGSFLAPVTIGTLAGTTSGTIAGTLPANLVPGTNYHIRLITSNPAIIGAANTANLTVSAVPAPVISIVGTTTTLCTPTSTVLLTSGIATGTFVWKRNGTTIPGATASTYTAIGTAQAGTYTVTVTNAGGCTATSAPLW